MRLHLLLSSKSRGRDVTEPRAHSCRVAVFMLPGHSAAASISKARIYKDILAEWDSGLAEHKVKTEQCP